jgi:2-methylcitrate dehydratase PrpD
MIVRNGTTEAHVSAPSPDHPPSASCTEVLAERARSVRYADLSLHARELVHHAFFDTIGCVLAGADSDEARLLAAWSLGLGGRAESTVLGRRAERLPAVFAGLVNATAGHALDFDDVSPNMTHPSVCLVPPLLAVAERLGADGPSVLDAYVTGFEVCTRLCRVLNPGHYYRGWHSMGTVNGLGVAAAVAGLLGLDRQGVATAMAIAASSAAGIRKNFGTMVKPLHAGQTAYHGVQAAELAAAGFVADAAILDGEHGFLEVYGDVGDERGALSATALELERSGLTFKRYACCGALHPAIDALLGLMAEEGVRAEHVRRIRCLVNARAPHVLVHHRAASPAEGRFSVEYTLAVAAVDGDAGPAQYTPDRVADREVQDLAERVEVSVDDSLPTGYALFPAIVTVETLGGVIFSRRADHAHGEPSDPLTAAEVRRKFASCAAVVLEPTAVTAALAAVEALPSAGDVRELVPAWAV